MTSVVVFMQETLSIVSLLFLLDIVKFILHVVQSTLKGREITVSDKNIYVQ